MACDLRRRATLGALLLVMGLGGCMSPGGAGLGFGAATGAPRELVRQVALYDGDVVIGGPPGYCIDTQASRRRGGDRFVLLASCASLGGGPAQFVDPAVITVSVLPRDETATQPTAAQIAASVAPAGVLEHRDAEGVSLVHLADGGDAMVPDGDPRYWRAGMVINGHLVGLAAYTVAGGALAGSEGEQVLSDMARTLRRLSPDQTPE